MATKQLIDNFLNTIVDTVEVAYSAPSDKDVVIDETNLAWMNGKDEAHMEKIIDIHDNEICYNMSSRKKCSVNSMQTDGNYTKS